MFYRLLTFCGISMVTGIYLLSLLLFYYSDAVITPI